MRNEVTIAPVVASLFVFPIGMGDETKPRKLEVEHRAAARGITEANLAAELRNDLLYDVQPEAGAALLPCIRAIGLSELAENPGPKFGRNSRSVIPDGNPNIFTRVLNCDDDLCVLRRELDSIRKQIGDNL